MKRILNFKKAAACSHLRPLAAAQVAASGCSSGCASGCSSGCKWLRKWLLKWLRKRLLQWLQVAALLAASGCALKWLPVAARSNGCQWLHALTAGGYALDWRSVGALRSGCQCPCPFSLGSQRLWQSRMQGPGQKEKTDVYKNLSIHFAENVAQVSAQATSRLWTPRSHSQATCDQSGDRQGHPIVTRVSEPTRRLVQHQMG